MKVEVPLTVECCIIQISPKKLGIFYRDAGQVAPAARPVYKRRIVGACYGPLVYEDFRSCFTYFRTSWKSIIKFRREKLLKLANMLQETAMERNIVQYSVWTVLTPFQAMRRVNYGTDLQVDDVTEGEQVLNERKNIVEFYYSYSSSLPHPSDHIVY